VLAKMASPFFDKFLSTAAAPGSYAEVDIPYE
jgi:hypothetical protein